MQYETTCSAVVEGNHASLWATWADMAAYPSWDPREEETRLDGPFAVGTTGWSKQVGRRPGGPFTITVVQPEHRWVNECPLPGGRLVIDHTLDDDGDNRVRLTKTYTVHGPMALAFRLVFARAIRRDVPGTLAALASEAARRDGIRAA